MTMKKSSPKVDINHLAVLASLPLTPAEKKSINRNLSSILDHVGKVQQLELEQLPVTAQVTQKTNQFREDVVTPGLTQSQALSSAPKSHQGFFVVPGVISYE